MIIRSPRVKGLISVIIPTKDRLPELKVLLTRLVVQTDRFFEVIVVDGSSSRQEKILKDWLAKREVPFNFYYLKTRPAVAYQRNIGAEHSLGEYLVFLDDDGLVAKDYLQKVRHHLESNRNIAGGQAVIVSRHKNSFWSNLSDWLFLLRGYSLGKGGQIKLSGEFQSNKRVSKATEIKCLSTGCCFYRRQVFDRYRFDENLPYPGSASDFEFSYRAAKRFRFMIFPDLVFFHRESTKGKPGARVIVANRVWSYWYNFCRHSASWWRLPFYFWAHLGYFLRSFCQTLQHSNWDYLVGWANGWKKILKSRPKLLLIGSFPPPCGGTGINNQTIRESYLTDKYRLKFFDITDRRGMDQVGRFEIGNLWQAFAHSLIFPVRLLVDRPIAIYLNISPGRWGFVRDSVFILVASCLGQKIIFHFGGSDAFLDSWQKENLIMKRFLKSIFRRANWVIFISKKIRDEMIDWAPFLSDHSIVIPNGVNINLFDRFQKQGTIKKKQVLFIGQTIRQKGLVELVEAFRILIRQFPDYWLVIMGENDNRLGRQLKKKIEREKLPISLIGEKDGQEKARLFLESQIFCLPSYQESFSLATAEAMAAGLPLVLTNFGGALVEHLDQGQNALFASQKPEDIAEQIAILIENPDLRRKMSNNNRLLAKQRFDRVRFIHGLDRLVARL